MNEQRPEVLSANFNPERARIGRFPRHDGDPNALLPDGATRGPRGSLAIRLRRLGRVDSVEAGRDLPSN